MISCLTPEQQKAFNKFKKAYDECSKRGIIFVNVNETMMAFDSELVESSTDISEENTIPIEEVFTDNFIRVPSAWVDTHPSLILTDKGMEVLKEEE
jgi:hypothetical protein